MQRGKTGEGYIYYRIRSYRDGEKIEDETIYEHQLAALEAGYSVFDVWGDNQEVHHLERCKLYNLPENVEPVDVEEHENRHGRGGSGRPPLRVVNGGTA